MRILRAAVVVLALALVMVLVAGEAGQTQGTGGSDGGTAPTGDEGSRALTGGSVQQAGVQPSALESEYASIRIPATALKPSASGVEWAQEVGGGCVYATSGDPYIIWSAPLYLPEGAIIRYFRMYYNDLSDTTDCQASLTLYREWGAIGPDWGVSSSGTGESSAITSELDVIINYDDYSYVINWMPMELGPDMKVCGFRVYYDAPWGLALLPHLNNGD